MRLQLLSADGPVKSVNASGRITQSAFEAEDEPLAVKLGDDVYGGRLLLSLEGADYLDSRGVGWLLKCHRRFRQAGGVIVVHSIPAVILDVLKVLHMDEVLHLSTDEERAREIALAGHR
ncbi:MAG TPA: STAS domain-containing protein [Pirellulales bacterium]|jgi:anti-anti-sigma factor